MFYNVNDIVIKNNETGNENKLFIDELELRFETSGDVAMKSDLSNLIPLDGTKEGKPLYGNFKYQDSMLFYYGDTTSETDVASTGFRLGSGYTENYVVSDGGTYQSKLYTSESSISMFVADHSLDSEHSYSKYISAYSSIETLSNPYGGIEYGFNESSEYKINLYTNDGSNIEFKVNNDGFTLKKNDAPFEAQDDSDIVTKHYLKQLISSGIILESPNGTPYRIIVSDDGTLITESNNL